MLAPWKKSYDKSGQHSKKQRHHFGTKVLLVKVMVFPVVMYRCESWIIKKAEHQRIDAFELWCWRRLLRVCWIARRSNQSLLKKINPEYSLEGQCWSWSSSTLATWWEDPIHWKRPWCWKKLEAKGEGGGRGWDDWMASLTQWTWIWTSCGRVEDRGAWRAAVHGVTKSRIWLCDWTTTKF